jgi:hypothetical protein
MRAEDPRTQATISEADQINAEVRDRLSKEGLEVFSTQIATPHDAELFSNEAMEGEEFARANGLVLLFLVVQQPRGFATVWVLARRAL